MPKEVTAAFGRLTHALREFTVGQRTIAIIGVAVLVVGAIALGAWFTRSQYSPLFSGLSGSDASAIVDQLDADGIPTPSNARCWYAATVSRIHAAS